MIIKHNDISYGHFLVRKAEICYNLYCMGVGGWTHHTGEYAYGVFRIDHRENGYPDNDITNPLESHKIHLTPVGNKNFESQDCYTCDVLSKTLFAFDTYYDALNWAASMNNIKDVN